MTEIAVVAVALVCWLMWVALVCWLIGFAFLGTPLDPDSDDPRQTVDAIRGKPEPVPPAKQPLRKRIATLWNDGLYPREPNH